MASRQADTMASRQADTMASRQADTMAGRQVAALNRLQSEGQAPRVSRRQEGAPKAGMAPKAASGKRCRISLDELLRSEGLEGAPYAEQAARIDALAAAGAVWAVKSSPTNGKRPALHVQWWRRVAGERDDAALFEELNYRLHPLIQTQFYRAHPAAYAKDRAEVLQLSAFLSGSRDMLARPASVNERSFQIWGREKFLKRKRGEKLLRRCGIVLGEGGLNAFETAEPLAAFALCRQAPQNVLVLENLDAFCSLRRLLAERPRPLLGTRFGTIVYGGGKSVAASLRQFSASAEPYLQDRGCRFYYFGDLDWEGLGIYEAVAKAFAGQGVLEPFVPAYAKMAAMAEGRTLPESDHRPKDCPRFFSFFPAPLASAMRAILEGGRRVPQEIVTAADWEADWEAEHAL